MATRIERVVKRMAALRPRYDADALGRDIATFSEVAIAAALTNEKATTLGLRRLTELDPRLAERVRLLPPLADRLERMEGTAKLLPGMERDLNDVAVKLGMSIWRIKGLAARPWYDDATARDIGYDIDLMVTTVDDALSLTSWLIARDYFYARTELPWLKRSETGGIYGQINLRSSSPGTPTVDIHFGGYSVRHCGLVPLDDSDTVPGLRTSKDTDTLVHLIANAAGDYFILAKDLNDLAAALENESIRWDELLHTLKRLSLDGFFYHILEELTLLQMIEGSRRELVDELKMLCRRELIRPAAGNYWSKAHWRRRCLGTAAHAFQLGRKRSLRHSLRMTIGAARYYSRPLELSIDPGSGPVRMKELNQLQCVRLVPQRMIAELLGRVGDPSTPNLAGATCGKLADKLLVETLPAGDVVVTLGSVFVPTIDYRINKELAESVV